MVDEGQTPAGQLAVGFNGEVVVFESFGEATDDSRFATFSVSKALMAALAWQLIDGGSLATDMRVADVLPGFGDTGKDEVRIKHLLTHTCGFPNAPLGPPVWFDRASRLEKMSRWRLDHPPGEQCIYHPTGAHWALAESISEVTGLDYRSLANTLLADLGIGAARFGEPHGPGDWSNVIDLVEVGDPPSPEEMEELIGLSIDLREVTNDILLRYNENAIRDLGVPGGGLIATAADLAMLYQALLHNPGDRWSAAMLRMGTAEVQSGDLVDPMFGYAANRTLGLALAGHDGKAAFRQSFGHQVSGQAFGHAGAGGQIAWADPASGISFCFLRNGLDRHVVRSGRASNGLSSRAACLSQPAE